MIRFPLSAGEEAAAARAVELAEHLMVTEYADVDVPERADITTKMVSALTTSQTVEYAFTPGELAVFAYTAGLVGVLCTVRGNIAAVARRLELSDNTLRHQMQALDLVRWNQRWHPRSGRQPKDGIKDMVA